MSKINKYILAVLICGVSIFSSAHAGNLDLLLERYYSAGAVFAMTNDVNDNQIAMFGRARNGRLRLFGKVSTGGTGSLNQPIDPLASQNSLILSEDKKFLLAANAGSSEISVFSVDGYKLGLVDKVPSNGIHPISITINDDVVYVLNTGGDGTVAGFKLSAAGKLTAIPGSVRDLALNGTVPPQVNDVNHQILFNPYGDRLIVTGGINTNQIKVWSVDGNGLISENSVDNASAGANPFSIVFSRFGDLLVAEGEATNAMSSYDLRDDNTLSPISSTVPNGKAFSCWVVTNGNRFVYLVNTGTDDISLYETGRDGVLTLIDANIASPGQGAIQTDAAFSANGRYLYTVNGGTGLIGVLRVNNTDGGLELIQQAQGLEDRALLGLQGIAAY